MKRLLILWTVVVVSLVGSCGGGDIGTNELDVQWVFPSGDCVTNRITTVRILWSANGGVEQQNEFACSASQGRLGKITKGGSYAIRGLGLGADGKVLMESFGQVSNFPDGRTVGPTSVTLRPKSSNVIVKWNGCPASVILPYFISIYPPPSMPGDPLIGKIKQVQETCTAGMAVLDRIAPGEYVVELDSRAVTPKILATKAVTVVAGDDATVTMNVP